MPIAVGSVLIIAFNGVLLLHVARLTALVLADWRRSGQAEKVSNTITRHPGLLNPFFGSVPIDGFDRLLHLVPKFSVGILLGFHLLFVLTPPDVQVFWGAYLLPVSAVVVCLHVAGNFAATYRIGELTEAMFGWKATVLIGVGYVAGMVLAYQIMIALVPA